MWISTLYSVFCLWCGYLGSYKKVMIGLFNRVIHRKMWITGGYKPYKAREYLAL